MRIAIIGAGFSGVITAVHLLRGDGNGSPCSVMLINRSGRTARGIAYGTRSAAHVLNVPAGCMSAFADDEESFLRFARERDSTVSGASFVSRSLYGDYLDHLLFEAETCAPSGVTLDQIVGHAVDIDVAPDTRSASLTLADGRVFEADRVVLALGNFAPANPFVADRSFYSSSRYVRDPWAPGALDQVAEDDSVLLIGTGLTMYDIALELAARGVRRPMHALSRRGLTAYAHRQHGHPPTFDHLPRELEGGQPTALSYLRAVRSEIARLPAGQGNWRDVIASLRPVTPALWSAMSDRERARFMRHLRPFWEVHRHRAAPEPAAAVEQLIADGRLIVSAGRIVAFEENAGDVRVSWRPRGASADSHGTFTRVINCTGPTSNLRSAAEPLIDNLIEKGLLACDELGLGVRVSDDGALIGFNGVPSGVLFYVGPLLKARYWEATAVPELRVHAARLAENLRASAMSTRAHIEPQFPSETRA
ncbi:MAG TPA: FAD/NAD(P)-binding protein [Gemmatimonadaceae bacterium]